MEAGLTLLNTLMFGSMILLTMLGLIQNSLMKYLDGITVLLTYLLSLTFLNGNTSFSVEAPEILKKEEIELQVKCLMKLIILISLILKTCNGTKSISKILKENLELEKVLLCFLTPNSLD